MAGTSGKINQTTSTPSKARYTKTSTELNIFHPVIRHMP